MKIIDTNYLELKDNFATYIDKAKSIGDSFGGPSLYFHGRALEEAQNNFLGNSHLEMIYATLASWGMHRMGITKTKLVEFTVFKKTILKEGENLKSLKNYKIESLDNSKLSDLITILNNVFSNLKISESEAKLVANSKTLAHILPNLVPPIDRQYTIRFFTTKNSDFLNPDGKFKAVPNFKNTDENEYLQLILEKLFDFTQHIKNNNKIKVEPPFNTSFPKIFDNLIMTYVKSKAK
jgi:hypothetical protein